MDALSLGFVILIVLLGGAIAAGGDFLGSRIGKKRLSLWGLRPKHTARVVTISIGMLIPFLTILVVAFASQDVRIWLTEGRRAIAQRDEARRQLEETQRMLGLRQRDLDTVERQRTQTQLQLSSLQTRVTGLVGRIESQQKTLAQQQRSLEVAKNAEGRATARAAGALAQLQGVRNNLSAARASLLKTQATLEREQQKLVTLEKRQQQVSASYEKLNREYTQLDAEWTRVSADLSTSEEQRRTLNDELGKVRDELNAKKSELDQITADLRTARSNIRAAEAQLEYITNSLGTAVATSRTQDLIFRANEELVRLPVNARLSREDAQKAVDLLFQLARAEAMKRGAQKRGGMEAADFAPITDDSTNRVISRNEQAAALIERLINRPTESVLIAYSFLNAFRTEAVAVGVRDATNPVVYREGQTVAEIRIDGRQTQEQIYQEFSEFVGREVRQRAQQDGLIPRMTKDGPTIGEVSSQQILDLVSQIKAENRTIRLTAFARQETRAADPLELSFRIR